MDKNWIERGVKFLEISLKTLHELNELDWKISLSEDKRKLAEHLSAFSNQVGGGFFVFGVDDNGNKVGVTSLYIK
jgi:predicted HTH transcriptional regulator